jgi:hypothetical protein
MFSVVIRILALMITEQSFTFCYADTFVKSRVYMHTPATGTCCGSVEFMRQPQSFGL